MVCCFMFGCPGSLKPPLKPENRKPRGSVAKTLTFKASEAIGSRPDITRTSPYINPTLPCITL